MQLELLSLNIVPMLVRVIAHSPHANVVAEAVSCSIAMLLGGNSKVGLHFSSWRWPVMHLESGAFWGR